MPIKQPTQFITSLQNPLVKELKKLINSLKARREQETIALEGIHLTQSFLESGNKHIYAILIREDAQQNPEILAILKKGYNARNIIVVPEKVMSAVSSLSTPSEIISFVQYPSPTAFNTKETTVCLENIQDPGNLGTIFRSASAAGITQVILSSGCTDAYSTKTMRAAMGAHFKLNIYEQANIANFLKPFQGKKIATILDKKAVSLYECNLISPVAFIFGNEGNGISSELIEIADTLVTIPMPGKQIESLNVAMAATICLFEQVRQTQSRY